MCQQSAISMLFLKYIYINLLPNTKAFFYVPTPDGKEDGLGLTVLDEPSSKQSDAHVLALQMKYTSKQPVASSLLTVRQCNLGRPSLSIVLLFSECSQYWQRG